jgi:hypothetical protein
VLCSGSSKKPEVRRTQQREQLRLILHMRTRWIAKRKARPAILLMKQIARGESSVAMLFRRIVVQVLPEPSLDFYHADPFPVAVVGDLITVDFAEAEIS